LINLVPERVLDLGDSGSQQLGQMVLDLGKSGNQQKEQINPEEFPYLGEDPRTR